MQSWFKLDRSVFSNEIITRDAEHLSIWCYLLSCSVYNPHQVMFDGKPIILKKDQLITSRRRISISTKVNESKVQRVLSTFEKAHLIKQQTCSQNRLITLLQTSFNYNGDELNEQQNEQLNEQLSEQQNEQQSNNRQTAGGQQANTYKNNKKYKKEIRENYYTRAREKEKEASQPSYDLDEFLKKSVHLKYIPKSQRNTE